MCSKDGFRYAAGLEQTEAEQNRVAHTAPNGPGYIRCLSDLLDQHRIDADNHHNQKGLEAQRQQGFQVVLADAAPLRIAQRGNRSLSNHNDYIICKNAQKINRIFLRLIF